MESNSHIVEHLTETEVVITRGGDQKFIEGYAARWYDPNDSGTVYSRGDLHERIHPNAFDEVLRSGVDIEAHYNHDRHLLLGSTSTKTLFLRADDKGLRFSIPYDETDPAHQLVAAKLRKGMIRGCSFNASGCNTRPQKENGKWFTTIQKVDKLTEVSVCHKPAYSGTAVIVRSEDEDKIKDTEARIARAMLI